MENSMLSMNVAEFTASLASKAPVPGGGGAAALGGALAAALASMVCELTAGKKKYARFEEDISRVSQRAGELREELLRGIDEDAAAFEPLSRAYSIPKDDPGRAEVMEEALRTACAAPMTIAEKSAQVIGLLSELAEKGCQIAVSDVGVGTQLARAALISAGLNVRINIRSMRDRRYAGALRERLEELERKYIPEADAAFGAVMERIEK